MNTKEQKWRVITPMWSYETTKGEAIRDMATFRLIGIVVHIEPKTEAQKG